MTFPTSPPSPMTDVPTIFDCLSGAFDDVIWSHNPYGPYSRPRSAVTNPNTAQQDDQRDAFASISKAWRDTLTSSQRAAWIVRAREKVFSNHCRQHYTITGQCAFSRANIARVHAGLARVDTAPNSLADLPLATVPAIQSTAMSLARLLVPDDWWVRRSDATLLVYFSPPLSPVVNFYVRPHRLAGVIEGSSASPPIGVHEFTLPFVPDARSRISCKQTLVLDNGQISLSRFQVFEIYPAPAVVAITSFGPSITVEFDQPLAETALPSAGNFPKRFARRNGNSWFLVAPGVTISVDHDLPELLTIQDSSPTIVANTAALSYNAAGPNYLHHRDSLIRVGAFDHNIPYP